MPYRNKTTGETISDQEFQSRFGSETDIGVDSTTSLEAQPTKLGFGERLKLSFGGPQAIKELKQREEEAGLRGRPDLGDIADIAGTALPIVGATVGGALGGGAIGAGVGAIGGEAIRRFGGKLLGVREDVSVPKELAQTAISGVATAGVAKVGQVVGRYVAERLPKLLGLFTGETEVVAAALRNPTAADLGVKQGDVALRKAIQEGSKRSIQLRDNLIQGHKLAFDKIVGQYKSVLSPKPGLYKSEMLSSFKDVLKAQGVKVTPQGDLNFSTSKIVANPGEISKIQNAYTALREWKDFSLGGMNEYKQLVGKLTRFADEAGIPSKSPTLGKYYHSLDNLIKERLPKSLAKQYGEANKRFSDTIELYDDMVDAFNRGDPFTRISQVFGKNKDSLRMLLDFYEKKTGIDIPAIQAGRELAAERSAAFGFLNPREWIDLLISPQKQARFVTGTARTQQFTRRLFGERLRAGARGGTAESLRTLFRKPTD